MNKHHVIYPVLGAALALVTAVAIVQTVTAGNLTADNTTLTAQVQRAEDALTQAGKDLDAEKLNVAVNGCMESSSLFYLMFFSSADYDAAGKYALDYCGGKLREDPAGFQDRYYHDWIGGGEQS